MIVDIPHAWAALQARLEYALGPCVLAGGALRDLDNNRPVKDLDFFVKSGRHVPSYITDNAKKAEVQACEVAMRRDVPGLEITERIDPEYAEAFRDEIKFVWTCRVPGVEHDIQVILGECESLKSAVERVDFGLCMIGWDGRELYRAQEYLIDQASASSMVERVCSRSRPQCAISERSALRRLEATCSTSSARAGPIVTVMGLSACPNRSRARLRL